MVGASRPPNSPTIFGVCSHSGCFYPKSWRFDTTKSWRKNKRMAGWPRTKQKFDLQKEETKKHLTSNRRKLLRVGPFPNPIMDDIMCYNILTQVALLPLINLIKKVNLSIFLRPKGRLYGCFQHDGELPFGRAVQHHQHGTFPCQTPWLDGQCRQDIFRTYT